MTSILIEAGPIRLRAELYNNDTARAIANSLPLDATAQTWGDEIYFEIPLALDEAGDATEDVQVGQLGYWPVGHAFCLFFGPTPVSRGDQPRAASPVNLFGEIRGDPSELRQVPSGARVRVSAVDRED